MIAALLAVSLQLIVFVSLCAWLCFWKWMELQLGVEVPLSCTSLYRSSSVWQTKQCRSLLMSILAHFVHHLCSHQCSAVTRKHTNTQAEVPFVTFSSTTVLVLGLLLHSGLLDTLQNNFPGSGFCLASQSAPPIFEKPLWLKLSLFSSLSTAVASFWSGWRSLMLL